MPYKDLRQWLEKVDRIGELVKLEGVHWDLEAGAVCNLTDKAVLFDKFPGYPAGYRVMGPMQRETLPRFFITANWSTEARGTALTKAWMERMRQFEPVPPRWVKSGPVMENAFTGKKVDLTKFPVPKRHPGDGGRFIGTGHTVIMQDPETGRINLGTYRLQLHDRYTTGIHASEGKDGRIIMEKYHNQGKPCPVVVAPGIDPAMFLASIYHLTHLQGGELEFIGWMKGQPEEVIKGKFTGLPIPANAEIAFEGEIPPGVVRKEGPFSEWTGYCKVREFPIIQVKALYHRNDPILTFALGAEFHPQTGMRVDFKASALVWDQMEKAGVRGIKGVAGYNVQRLVVVAIKNLYAGHSMQAGLVASQCHAGSYGNNYVIVVDENVDPSNIQEVMWQVVMRTEPNRAVQVLEHCWASHLTIQDPSYIQRSEEYAMRHEKATYTSKAIIDACVPLEWDPGWHGEIRISQELKAKVLKKWGALLK